MDVSTQSHWMAFQLADDTLDYTAIEEKFGKENGIDLQEGKLTLPLIRANKLANSDEKQIIKNALMAEHIDRDTFSKIHEIIHKYKGFEAAHELAKSYTEQAKEWILPFRTSIEKDLLLQIADFVVARES